MISHQQARRNLSPGELIFANSMVAEEIAEENKKKVSKAVSESNRNRNSNSVQMDGTENKNSESKSHTSPTHTREQVAKLSGVGTGTVARYDAVMKSDDEELGRRNLSPIQRIAVAEKYRPIYEKQARENKSKAGGDKKSIEYKKTVVENLPQAIEQKRNPTTDSKLASIAGVSEKTYRMGAKVLHSNNDELKQRVLSGETAISASYRGLEKKVYYEYKIY